MFDVIGLAWDRHRVPDWLILVTLMGDDRAICCRAMLASLGVRPYV